MKSDFSSFLKEIAPYVIVVGSFARKTETDESDIDCYLRSYPISERDYENNITSYMPKILEIIQKYGYKTESVFPQHIAIPSQNEVMRMVEITSSYRIPCTEQIFSRNIYGVQFLCAVDDKEADFSNCYDNEDWSDEINDMYIKYPLPPYPERL